MAKINCPSCGAAIEIPAEFIAELKAALASGDTAELAALMKALKESIDKSHQPPPPPPTPEPLSPEAPLNRRGVFYDE